MNKRPNGFTLVELLVGLLTLMGSEAAQAASYWRMDGVTVDPIQYKADYYAGMPWLESPFSGDHHYSGGSLYPGQELGNADLDGAELPDARLSGVYFTGSVDLHDANLSGADLDGATLFSPQLGEADLTGADLSRIRLVGHCMVGGVKVCPT